MHTRFTSMRGSLLARIEKKRFACELFRHKIVASAAALTGSITNDEGCTHLSRDSVFFHCSHASSAHADRKKKSAGPRSPHRLDRVRRAIASWYGDPYHGRRARRMVRSTTWRSWTAAHRTLPFGTWVRVTNLSNEERRWRCAFRDRGPFVDHRIIDLSRARGP